MNINKGIEHWNKAKKLFPGGTQLLSKRAEMFLPGGWPAYYKKAKGVTIWDLDGNKYVDMSIMGVGACTLGYADGDVNKAVKQVIDLGSMSTLNCYEEIDLAELLLKRHPWADSVRYARTGGEAMAIAVRIARAYTKKDKIAFCGYHGWHDWYLSSNLADDANLDGHLLEGLAPKGVPRGLINTTFPFEYNNIKQLEKIVEDEEIGVIVMEPMRHQEPKDNFLQNVQEIAKRVGAVFIIDEISSGWRMNVGGLHLKLNIEPDIAVFAKAMSNGYPMAAIIGKESVMDIAQESFISSTYWTGRVGPTAALATINKMEREDVPQHLKKIGKTIGEGIKKRGEDHGLDIEILPPKPLVTFTFNYENSLEIKTLFTQEMLKRGFLASQSVYVSYSHTEDHVEKYLENVDVVFGIIKKSIDQNNVVSNLEGPVAHSGFQRLT